MHVPGRVVVGGGDREKGLGDYQLGYTCISRHFF